MKPNIFSFENSVDLDQLAYQDLYCFLHSMQMRAHNNQSKNETGMLENKTIPVEIFNLS